jgi:hypothetical protein
MVIRMRIFRAMILETLKTPMLFISRTMLRIAIIATMFLRQKTVWITIFLAIIAITFITASRPGKTALTTRFAGGVGEILLIIITARRLTAQKIVSGASG